MEEHTGFEPARSAWKAEMLPLHQCSVSTSSPYCRHGRQQSSQSLENLPSFWHSYICFSLIVTPVLPVKYYQLVFSRSGYRAMVWIYSQLLNYFFLFLRWNIPLPHPYRPFLPLPANQPKVNEYTTIPIWTIASVIHAGMI